MYLNNIAINLYSYFSFEEFVVLIFIFYLSNLILICTVVELIWPTHFFNKKHSYSVILHRYRTFYEILLKLRFNKISSYLNKYLVKTFIKNKV